EDGVTVRPAQQDAVAGDQAFFRDQQAGDAAGEGVEVGIGPAAMVVDDGERVGVAGLEQFGRGIEAVGILKLRQVEAELGQEVGGWQPVFNEAVVAHSGTTAVASISISAAGSDKWVAASSAIAG